jgi:hypothetical protein
MHGIMIRGVAGQRGVCSSGELLLEGKITRQKCV